MNIDPDFMHSAVFWSGDCFLNEYAENGFAHCRIKAQMFQRFTFKLRVNGIALMSNGENICRRDSACHIIPIEQSIVGST